MKSILHGIGSSLIAIGPRWGLRSFMGITMLLACACGGGLWLALP